MTRTKKPEKKKPIQRTQKVASAVKRVYEGRTLPATPDPATPVTIDRRRFRDRRRGIERRQISAPVVVERRKLERRVKVSRRRQIDPTTCERDYTADEIEFMTALDQYKRTSGRMFPTCSEILEVVRKLGYEKRSPVVSAPSPSTSPGTMPALPMVGTS